MNSVRLMEIKFLLIVPAGVPPVCTHVVYSVSISADKIGSATEKILSMLFVSCVTKDLQDQGRFHTVFLSVRGRFLCIILMKM